MRPDYRNRAEFVDSLPTNWQLARYSDASFGSRESAVRKFANYINHQNAFANLRRIFRKTR